MKLNLICVITAFVLLLSLSAMAQYPAWQHSGTINIITTPDGADLPVAASENNFPLLVRLTNGFFDFSQAKAGGADIRFSSGTTPLPYQIEEWDAAGGKASIWVLIPNIKGNAVQPINIHWGNAAATSESSGSAVFSAGSNFLSVFHLDDPTTDEVGTLSATNVGTTGGEGMIGSARQFAGGQGINGGENITNWVTGASPHTTSAWFRAEGTGARIVAWGTEAGQGKVQMWINGPPHIRLDGYFSNASLTGTRTRFPFIITFVSL